MAIRKQAMGVLRVSQLLLLNPNLQLQTPSSMTWAAAFHFNCSLALHLVHCCLTFLPSLQPYQPQPNAHQALPRTWPTAAWNPLSLRLISGASAASALSSSAWPGLTLCLILGTTIFKILSISEGQHLKLFEEER